MSRMDLLKEPLTRAIERVVRSFDEAFESQMSEGRRRVADAAETLKSELPGALLADPALASLVESQHSGHGTLLDAASRIDSAASQGEVLAALLAGARGFCGRSAFVLVHESCLEVWSGDGFDNNGALSGQQLAFTVEPWHRLRDATSAVRLGSEACASAAAQLGVDSAEDALFVPFMLRNRLGGFLYADRRGQEDALDGAALSLLTHLAALSLETLAIRGSGLSPTLQNRADGDHEPLPIYGAKPAAAPVADGVQDAAPAAAPDATVDVVEVETTVEIETLPEVEAAPAVEDVVGDGTEAVSEEAVLEEATLEDSHLDATSAGASAIALSTLEESHVGADLAGSELSKVETASVEAAAEEAAASAEAEPAVEAEPAIEAGPTTVRPAFEEADDLFGEDTATEQIQVDASFPNIRRQEKTPAVDDAEGDTLELEPLDPALMAGSDQESEGDATVDTNVDTGAFELDDDRFAKPKNQQTVRFELDQPKPDAPAGLDTPPAPSSSAADPAALAANPAAKAADPAAFSEDATVMSQRGAVYRPPAEPAAPPAPSSDAADATTSQVVPPEDLSGPGSAFNAGGSAGDEALREEARRLARLLVSEIKLYNEDQLEEGRREGSIYNRLKEDIDRSRKMYHERIDPRLQDADRFFYQELVDRLAGGNADLLGM